MRHLYPILTTPIPRECRDFYVKAFDAHVLFDSDWYVQLSVGTWEIGFMKPNPPQRVPIFHHTTVSRGLVIVVEVPDVQIQYDLLRERGIETLGKPEPQARGELSFSVSDPAGTVLNIVERSERKVEEI